MSHNIYIYILVMAAVTYLIRMLPLALSRKEITNPVYQIISVLCSLRMSGSHDISGDPFCHRQCDLSCCGIYCGTDRGI